MTQPTNPYTGLANCQVACLCYTVRFTLDHDEHLTTDQKKELSGLYDISG